MGDPFDRPPHVPMPEIAQWLEAVAAGEWTWTRNSRCKYVTLKIDTRNGAYRVEDRNGDPVSFDDVTFQYRADPARSGCGS